MLFVYMTEMAGEEANAQYAAPAGTEPPGKVSDMDDELKRHVASKLVRMTSQL